MSIEISVISEGLTCQTAGLLNQLGYEISATVDSLLLLDECSEFVQFIGDYAAAGNAIEFGETVKYGYWFIKAELDDRSSPRDGFCLWRQYLCFVMA
ncbi:hypothetical protein ACO0LO_09900 [Undibacterium sp. TJN25]|uniref:hypothetical protein n=1 Tax=Undibacterium sp. TJN25 TaxID=3413056 RepID=UPI003BF2D74B